MFPRGFDIPFSVVREYDGVRAVVAERDAVLVSLEYSFNLLPLTNFQRTGGGGWDVRRQDRDEKMTNRTAKARY